MPQITDLLSRVYQGVAALSADVTLYILFGAYAAIYSAALLLTIFNTACRKADKRPFMSFTNAFAAVTFAVMLIKSDIPLSILTAATFWCAGYLLYGLLVLVSRRKVRQKRYIPSSAEAVTSPAPPTDMFTASATPARGNVRLEHALSVTEKLLAKELGRGDRQEAERIKTMLSVLQAKPSLTTEENEALNENFNTLLKLMAKYNV